MRNKCRKILGDFLRLMSLLRKAGAVVPSLLGYHSVGGAEWGGSGLVALDHSGVS